MNDQVWWYATRAAGLMTWSTAVASVIVGLLLSTRAIKSRTGPWMLDLHRFLGGISVLFLAVHVVTLYFDSFVEFGPRVLFIPGESTWNSEAAAWGIIAMYSLVLVELTSLLRKWISASVWRTFHMLSIVTAVAGTYHAILGGSDVDNPLAWVIAGAGSAIVIALVAMRLRKTEKPTSPRVAKANDREALLKEMRDRLESLPIPENTAQPELSTDGGTLPRRAPVTAGAMAGSDAAPLNDAGVFDPFSMNATTVDESPTAAPAADPFAATPPGSDPFAAPNPGAPAPEPADLPVGRPVSDPFARGHAAPPAPPAPALGTDPFAAAPAAAPTAFDAPAPFDASAPADPFAAVPPAPAMETPVAPTAAPFFEPAPQPPATPGDTPFPAPATQPEPEPYAYDPASPFGSETPAAPPPAFHEPPLDPLQPPASNPDSDLFAPASPAEEAAAQRSAEPFPELNAASANPFQPVQPTAEAISVPVADKPAPPPLPTEALDPTTGEPDEAAYTAWLVEWLAFAEKYGEETPDDPSRLI